MVGLHWGGEAPDAELAGLRPGIPGVTSRLLVHRDVPPALSGERLALPPGCTLAQPEPGQAGHEV